MIITPEEVVTFIGVGITLLLGILNYYNGAVRSKSISTLERGQYLESVNKSVQLANDRALAAETRANLSEERELALEKRIAALEALFTYRMVFDVKLGANPTIERAEISHLILEQINAGRRATDVH